MTEGKKTKGFRGAENNIFAAQLGFRGYKKTGRWTVFGSAKVFPGYNHQIFSSPSDEEYLRGVRGSESEFVAGGELRMEAAFHLTRDIAFVAGYDFYMLGLGIARVDNRATNDQYYLHHGLTFGFQINMP